MEYKPPENASSLLPAEARALFKRNGYYGTTAGFCFGYSQANLLVLPESLADDFEQFCKVNSAPFPLLYRSKVGDCSAPPLAKDSDVKTDLPRYVVYSQGKQVDDTLDLSGFEQSWGNLVSFYLGCSYTFDSILIANGVGIRHVERGLNVSIFLTNIQLKPVGIFESRMVTSMRPVKKCQLPEVFSITARYPEFHGSPIHIGSPARIGVQDVAVPFAGDPCDIEEGEVPVFWGCGVSCSQLLSKAAPPLGFTHFAGSMFISDLHPQPKGLAHDIDIVELSREDQPFFASVLERKSANILLNIEKSLLDDPGKRGVAHLYQKSDFLKATLALSHASRVAISTGFPTPMEPETDGLPGALAISQALVALGKDVVLICDDGMEELFESCAEHEVGGFKSPVEVLSCSKATEMWESANPDAPPWDCLVAIERAGRGKDKVYRTMNAVPLSSGSGTALTVDDIFLKALSNPLVSTIGIGDGGNELGMGKVYEQVVKHVRHGDKIACVIPADFVIASGVSNWAGYALSLGLFLVSSSPVHWRYRNHGIDADQVPEWKRTDFLPTLNQIGSLLKHMNELGVSDGITGTKDQSVDAMPLQVHLDKVTELTNHLVS